MKRSSLQFALVARLCEAVARRAVQVSPIEPSEAEWRTTDHLVVITDASGSMAREALIPEARAIAQSFVAGIPQGDVRAKDSSGYDASFIGFGGDARVATELAPIEAADALPAPNRSRIYGTAADLGPSARRTWEALR
jgi:hypothetical protein